MDTQTGQLEDQARVVENLLLSLLRQGSKRFSEHLLKYDLTIAQYSALSALEQMKNECSMSELAEQIQQSSATMTGIVDRLVDKQWVGRRRSEADRRAVYVQVTDAGLEMLRTVEAEEYQEVLRVLSKMTPTSREGIVRYLTEYMQAACFLEVAPPAEA